MILIMDYPKREGSWIRRLTPPALLGLAGILPGLIGTWVGNANPIQGLTFKQPLLLYRLFPNSTYGQGILLGAAITFLPVLILLTWIVATGKWKINLLAQAAMLVSLGGFLVLGLIASTKIGGGSNLHNLDMFILTLVFLTILAVTQMQLEFESTPSQAASMDIDRFTDHHIATWLVCYFKAGTRFMQRIRRLK